MSFEALQFEQVDGVVVWTGAPDAPTCAIVWAEDSADLIFISRSVLPQPREWRPRVGDVVATRTMTTGPLRTAFSLKLREEAGLLEIAGHLTLCPQI